MADISPRLRLSPELEKFFVSGEMQYDFETLLIKYISENPGFKEACLKVLFND